MHKEKLLKSGNYEQLSDFLEVNEFGQPVSNDCWNDGFSYCKPTNFKVMIFYVPIGEIGHKASLHNFQTTNQETLIKLKNIGIETIFISTDKGAKVEIIRI